jgi:hypothetical protein
VVISRLVLRMRNVSDKSCNESSDTHFMSKTFFCAIYDTVWENMVQQGRPQMTVWRMSIEFWKTMTRDTHSEYILIIAFPLQKSLRNRASMLRYTYIACLVYCTSKCNSFDVLVKIVFH